jgi:hypothetical protein
MGNKKKKETVNDTDSTDSLPKKDVWTPPDINFKSKKGNGRKSNVKCIYCAIPSPLISINSAYYP